MATIRPIEPYSFSIPSLTDMTVTSVAAMERVNPSMLSDDRATVYGTRAGKEIVASTDDGATWTNVFTHPGLDSIRGIWLTPDGEAMYSTENASVGGSTLNKSTGWSENPATATWRVVLNVSQKGNLQVQPGWGLSMAPKGHVREGLMVVTEYGGQGTGTDTPSEIGKVWRSWDYGATWEIMFILGEQVGVVQQHMHAVAYDQWFDAVIITYGDANGPNNSKSRISYTFDVTAPRAEMTWQHIFDSGTVAHYQAVTIHPTESQIILGGDGYPCGVYRVGRREDRTYGPVAQALTFRGGTDTGWISQRFYRHQSGEGPVFLAKQYTKDADEPVSLDVYDGGTYAEIWRDNANRTGIRYPNISAVGLTANGWVVGTYSHNTRATNTSAYYNFRARYVPAP